MKGTKASIHKLIRNVSNFELDVKKLRGFGRAVVSAVEVHTPLSVVSFLFLGSTYIDRYNSSNGMETS